MSENDIKSDVKSDVKNRNLRAFGTEEDDFDTVLADDISFTGEIRFEKPFMIKGRMNGIIDATSDLLIDTGAVVNADITTDRVVIRGKVTGNVIGRTLVHITSTGSVKGDITAPQVVLEMGSVFSGKCTMTSLEPDEEPL